MKTQSYTLAMRVGLGFPTLFDLHNVMQKDVLSATYKT